MKSVLQNQDAIKAVSASPEVHLKPTSSKAIVGITFRGFLTQLVEVLTPLRELIGQSECTLFTIFHCFGECINLGKTMVMIILMCALGSVAKFFFM